MDFICLEFWNKCDHANLLYQTGWKQRYFIDSDLCRPNYDIIQDGYKDGDGNFIKTLERECKLYRMDFLVFEFMLDFIHTIPSHDRKRLYLKNGEVEEISDLALEHEYVTAGIAKLTMTFRTRYIIKTNCCTNKELVGCISINHTAIIDIISYTDNRYTDPLNTFVNFGDRYIVTNLNGTQDIVIYSFNTNFGWTWIPEATNIYDYVLCTADGLKYIYYGQHWIECPSILTILPLSATTIKITGFAMPNSFVEIQYKLSSSGTWIIKDTISSSSFNNNGYIITGLIHKTQYDVRYRNYNHNCNYNYSPITSAITL